MLEDFPIGEPVGYLHGNFVYPALITDVDVPNERRPSQSKVRIYLVYEEEYLEVLPSKLVEYPVEEHIFPAGVTAKLLHRSLDMRDPPVWISRVLGISLYKSPQRQIVRKVSKKKWLRVSSRSRKRESKKKM